MLDCAFFRTEQGNEPAREWLRSLPIDDNGRCSKPLVDGMGGGLYEVRTKVERIQYRVLFCVVESTMILLHGFVKKARTEPDEIALGRDRLKVVRKQAATKPRREKRT